MQVFISYKGEEQEFADLIQGKVESWQYNTWMFVNNIPPSSSWPDEINRGLQSSGAVIGIMSPLALESQNVKNEWNWAIANNVKLLLLKYKECNIPAHYISIQYIDFTNPNNFEKQFVKLKVALRSETFSKAKDDPYYEYFKLLFDRINRYMGQRLIPSLQQNNDIPEPVRIMSQSDPQAEAYALFRKEEILDPLFSSDLQQSKKFNSLQEAYEQYDGRILLLGEIGAGKTFSLLHLCRDAIIQRMQDHSKPIPVLGIIPSFDFDKFKTIQDWLSNDYAPPHNLQELIIEGNIALYLDGLDELGRQRQSPTGSFFDPRKKFIEYLNQIPTGNKVIITCRSQDQSTILVQLQLNKVITLTPLGDEQIYAFLHKSANLYAFVMRDESLRNVLRTPLLLCLFAFSFHEISEVEQLGLFTSTKSSGDTLDTIINRYIEKRFEHESEKLNANLPFSLDQTNELLEIMAVDTIKLFHLKIRAPISVNLVMRLQDNFPYFTEQAERLHLIIQDKNTNGIEFVHSLFLNYYGLIGARKQLHSDDWNMRHDAVNVLGRIGDKRAFDWLIMCLNDQSIIVRNAAIWALGLLGDERALPHLTEFLGNKGTAIILGKPPMTIEQCAAEALRMIGTEEALEAVQTWEQSQKY